MSTEMNELKLRSGQIEDKLNRFQTYLNDFQLDTGDLSQLETRLANIDDILSEFEEVQLEIEVELSLEQNFDEQATWKELESFENKYFEAISKAKNILKAHSTPPVLVRNNKVSSDSWPSSCTPKLPALKIPEFFGLDSQWQSFYETFSALVHNNENLKNIEKFHYLLGSLKGEAAQVIKSLPVSDANYFKAFKLLSDRYSNRKAIVNAHASLYGKIINDKRNNVNSKKIHTNQASDNNISCQLCGQSHPIYFCELFRSFSSEARHAFGDSSEKACGCAIYSRSVNKNKETITRLLCAKSRVAPLKTICLPRLELCSALTLPRLSKKCLEVIELNVNHLYLYIDSKVVLAWLACEPRTRKSFVANRVSEIQQLTIVDKWPYISSDQNPANIISRGSRFRDLDSSSLGWNGPSSLSRSETQWSLLTNIAHYARNPASIVEYKISKRACLINTECQDFDIFGANHELKAIQNMTRNDEFSDYLSINKIDWHFMPARSSHFDGLWKAAVKSCEHRLKRIVGSQLLTYEEFYSILTQVEAVLNSRPIVALSTAPDELEGLTPTHLLIGRPLIAVPQVELNYTKVNHLKRYGLMQQMFQSFWSRWVQKYLHTLQQRTKWQFPKDPELTVGALVLLKEDHVPPWCWLLGRIVESIVVKTILCVW